MARLLPPESAPVQEVAQELAISAATLERWLAATLSKPGEHRIWTARARLEALIATASMDEAGKSAWCRENGLYPQELTRWCETAAQALADPRDRPASLSETKADRRRIKELERDLRRKERALAETTALLVLRKKLSAIFPTDEGEDA